MWVDEVTPRLLADGSPFDYCYQSISMVSLECAWEHAGKAIHGAEDRRMCGMVGWGWEGYSISSF